MNMHSMKPGKGRGFAKILAVPVAVVALALTGCSDPDPAEEARIAGINARSAELADRGFYDCKSTDQACKDTNKILDGATRDGLARSAQEAVDSGETSKAVSLPKRDSMQIPSTVYEISARGDGVTPIPQSAVANSDHGQDQEAMRRMEDGVETYFTDLGGELEGLSVGGQRVGGGWLGEDQGVTKSVTYKIGGVSYTLVTSVTSGDGVDLSAMNGEVLHQACDRAGGKIEELALPGEDGYQKVQGCVVPGDRNRLS